MHFSKTIGLAFAAITIAGSAFAADLPSRRVAPAYVAPAPMFTWAGFYVGLNAGYGWSQDNSVVTTGSPVNAGGFGPGTGPWAVAGSLAALNNSVLSTGAQRSFLFGGQAGYNFQFGSVVAGLETDFTGFFGGNNRTATTATFVSLAAWGFPDEIWNGAATASRKIDWLGTLRARVGYLVTPTFLLYATGGLAYGGVKGFYGSAQQEWFGFGFYQTVIGASSKSDTRFGYTAGAGLEWMFSPNWSLKGEYLYYDLGRGTTYTYLQQNLRNTPWGSAVARSSARYNGHIVRAGVNYHFNWGSAPVVAKY